MDDNYASFYRQAGIAREERCRIFAITMGIGTIPGSPEHSHARQREEKKPKWWRKRWRGR